MRNDSAGSPARFLVAGVLVVAFAALDLALRPRLPVWVGDNAFYVLIIMLVLEFVVIWRAVDGMSSGHR